MVKILQPHEKVALQIIDTWLGYRSRHTDVPGFQACIRKKGEIIFSKAYGFANIKAKQKLTPKHLCHVASHSKMVTSCALHMLQEQGALKLSDTLVTYLPQFKKHKDKRFKDITLRDLLTNRSGIFRDGLDSTFWDLEKPFLSEDQLIHEVLQSHLIYDVNTETKYSNIGFGLLGLVIKAVTGKPYAAFVEQDIVQRLPSLRLIPDYDPHHKPFADGHTRPFYEGQRVPMKHATAKALASATGVCANAESTSLFLYEYLMGTKLVSRTTQRELLSLNWLVKNTTEENYGLGLGFDKLEKRNLVGHSGGYPGFVSQTRFLKGTDYIFSFIINTNEHITLNVIKSMAQLIKKIEDTFTARQLKNISVVGPMMNKWGSAVYVLSQDKGISFGMGTWSLCSSDNVNEFIYEKGKGYIAPKISGYDVVGEPLTLHKNKTGQITHVKSGSFTIYPEAEFLKRSRKTFL